MAFGKVVNNPFMVGNGLNATSLMQATQQLLAAGQPKTTGNSPFAGLTGEQGTLRGFLSRILSDGSQDAPQTATNGATGVPSVQPMGSLPSLGPVNQQAPQGKGVGDPVATDLPPYARAFLNATSVGESKGAYDVRFTPQGGTKFTDLSKHPGIYEQGPDGPSSAAGRYQFVKSTWDRMGGGDFSPANQDRKAWQLAQQDYKARTGRDLSADLQNGGLTDNIMRTLGPTWAAWRSPSTRAQSTAEFNNSMSRYNQQAQATAPVQKVEVQPLPDLKGHPLQIMKETGMAGPLTESLIKNGVLKAADPNDPLSRIIENAPGIKNDTKYDPYYSETQHTGIFDRPNSIDAPLQQAIQMGGRFSTDGMRRSTNVEDFRNDAQPFVDDNGVPVYNPLVKNSDIMKYRGGTLEALNQSDAEAKRGDYVEMGRPFIDSINELSRDPAATMADRSRAMDELIRKMREREAREPGNVMETK